MIKPRSVSIALKFILFAFVSSCFVFAAQAETVRVGSGTSESHGHGYVFGSSTNATCWLVAPAHVLENSKGELVNKTIINKSGISGIAKNGYKPDPNIDLAFAQVKGFNQKCLSRLSSRSLDSLLEVGTDARLNLTNSSEGGAKALPLRIRSVDGGEAALYFSIEPTPSVADENPKIIQGYSGGVIDKNGSSALGDGDQILGLTLNVCDGAQKAEVDFESLFDDSKKTKAIICSEGHYAMAVRMDVVKSMFENAKQNQGLLSIDLSKRNQPSILNFTGKTISGEPSSLLNDKSCWSVEASENTPIVLDYLMPDVVNINRVVISSCTNSNSLKGVEIRGGQSVSSTKPYRYCSAKVGAISCSVGSRAPKVLRLIIIPNETRADIQSVLVE